jgi:hypothetical protein
MKRNLNIVISLVVLMSMFLGACAPAATVAPAAPATEAPAAPATTVATEAPAAPAAAAPATEAPKFNGKGGWLDKVVFSAIPDAEPAVAQIQAGTVDVYSATIDKADVFEKVKADANLAYAMTYGSSNQMLLNTVTCTDKTKLNPFSNQNIREAMNWAIDRNYVVQEIFGGLAKPKFNPFTTAFPDYARYADLFSAVETKYAYNLDKAKAVVDTEMPKMGATKGTDGKWQYQGKPVVLIGLIRTEDKRKEIGNYFSNQMETLGFTVDRQEKIRKEASPIWQGDPLPCTFNFYTAGWISPQIYRDEGLNFIQYNTGQLQQLPVMNAYEPTKELADVESKLYTNAFTSMDERRTLWDKALTMSMQQSWWGIWVNDSITFEAYSKNVEGASDLAGGMAGAQVYPYTARITGKEGGELRIANSAILVDAWNPIAGSNWIDDTIIRNFTTDYGVIYNPYTGLLMPKLVTKAEMVAQEGLPIAKPQGDWMTLSTAAKIDVPDDAWVDWDAITQKFVTAAEGKAKVAVAADQVSKVEAKLTELLAAVKMSKLDAATLTTLLTDFGTFYNTTAGTTIDVAAKVAEADTVTAISDKVTEVTALKTDAEKVTALTSYVEGFITGLAPEDIFTLAKHDYGTAKTKVTVVYTPDLWKTTWHDGSPMTVADFVFNMIMTFDPGKKDSKIYDPSEGASLDTYLTHFKGVKIVATDPLTIETYDDQFALDAENNVADWYPNINRVTAFAGGMTAWHNLTPAVQAEADGKMAFSKDKSTNNKVDYTSQVSGPTVEVQMGYVDQDITNKYIPFAPTMSQYLTADDAIARYNNLKTFYAVHKHIVLGTGPYYVDQVFPVEGSITVTRYNDYLYPAGQFDALAAPKLMTLSVDGPTAVVAGQEATFNATITTNDKPYATADMDKVSYTLFNTDGTILASGAVDPVSDGQYTITLAADVTSKLKEGTAKLTVAAASKVVSLPVFETVEFVVTK